jgi:hypothetical protein
MGSYTVRRMAVLLLLAAGLVALQPAAAGACSCAISDPQEMLDRHAAAFIGRPVNVSGGFQTKTWTFEVEKWLKQDLGKQVQIRSAADGAACGFELTEGQRAAIFIDIQGKTLSSGLCSTMDADAVLAHLNPQQPKAAKATLVVASSGEGGRHLWLFNDRGELASTTAHDGDEYLQDFTLCPGGRTAVELWSKQVIVRDLTTLEPVRTQRVAERIGRVWCRDEKGARLLAATRDPNTGDWDAIVSLREPDNELVSGAWPLVEVNGDHVIATVGRDFTELRRISLRTGQDDLIFKASDRPGLAVHVPAGIEQFTISPDGNRVAFEVTRYPEQGEPSSDAFIFDLRSLQIQARSHIDSEGATLRWVDDQHLVFTDYATATMLLSASDLRPAARLPKDSQWASLRGPGTTLLGMDGPRLSSVDTESGATATLATVPAQYAGWLLRLPQPLQVAQRPPGGTGRPTPSDPASEASEPPALPPASTPTTSVPTSPGVGPAVGAAVLLVSAIALVLVRRRRSPP